MIGTEKMPNNMLRNREIFAFAPHVSVEDEAWRRRLVSVSDTLLAAPPAKLTPRRFYQISRELRLARGE